MGKPETEKTIKRIKAGLKMNPAKVVRVRRWLIGTQGNRCVNCGKLNLKRGDLTIDHKVPLSKGGTNDGKNCQILCSNCNLKKGNKIE